MTLLATKTSRAAAVSTAAAPPTFLHVPTPGDHYSPATGSAVMTIIHALSRRHAAAGGASRIVVGAGTRHDYPVGVCVEVAFGPLPTRRQKLLDAAAGRIGLGRPFADRLYAPALGAIEPDFDGVVFLMNAPGAVGPFRQKLGDAKLVLYVHNELFKTYSRREARRVVGAADAVVCVSRFMADRLTAKLGRPDPKVRAVLNGVDTDRFTPKRIGKNPLPVILFVGRVLPEKGPDLLVRAAAKLAAKGRRFVLRIVGSSNFSVADPPTVYERDLRRLAGPLGDAAQFRPFVGRDGVAAEYQAADIFCAPSNWDEPCSLTVPEAMACGLPTVAARRGGLPEVGGDAVLYFDPPDVDALADQLDRLLADPDARADLGGRARSAAVARLDWARRYEDLTEQLGLRPQERP